MIPLGNRELERKRIHHLQQKERMAVNLETARQNSKDITRLRNELEALCAELAVLKQDTRSLIVWLNQIAAKYELDPIHHDPGER